jgi:predicted Fe-Mo cluster-binding NifX family protein
MKNEKTICLSSFGESLDSDLDPRFGRCQYFMIIKIEDGKIVESRAIKNAGLEQGHGAGTAAAETVGESGATTAISGDFGPKASGVLEQLGIKMIKDSGKIRDVAERYIKNEN